MTPEEKKDALLSEFSPEKALDIVDTMRWYALEFKYTEWVDYWKKVKRLIKASMKAEFSDK